jgi:hypothetical protein
MIAALLVALTLSLVWIAFSPVEDPYSRANTSWNGTSELANMGFGQMTWNSASPVPIASRGVLLIAGPTSVFTQSDLEVIKALLSGGGVVLIADNFGSGNQLLQLLGVPVSFDGRVLIDSLFYDKQPSFPTVFQFSGSGLTSGVNELVLNLATVLNVRAGSDVRLLATSSPFSFLDANRNGVKDQGEPSGSFPVLVQVAVGAGTLIVFSSPASFLNVLIHEAGNSVLLQNILKSAMPLSGGTAVALLDQTHIGSSPFTWVKLDVRGIFEQLVSGDVEFLTKLGLSGMGVGIVVVRFLYRRPRPEKAKPQPPEGVSPLLQIDSVMRLHPTWDRRTVEYVAREVEASMRWRRLHGRE